MSTKPKFMPGITLIELLVIAPIALLIVAGIVYTSIQLSNSSQADVTVINARTEINRALTMMERDITLSRKPLAEVKVPVVATERAGLLGSGVGSGNNRFIMILQGVATTTNTDDLAQVAEVARYAPVSGTDCSTTDPLDMNVIYFIFNNTLYRRLILPQSVQRCTQTAYKPWQVSTCAPPANTPGCEGHDQALLNAATMNITYKKLVNTATNNYQTILAATDGSTVAAREAALSEATMIDITLTSTIAHRNSSKTTPVTASISVAL